MNLFQKKTKPKVIKIKKQIYVDEEQYRQMKALLFLRGVNVSAWIASKMAEELKQHEANTRSK